jgi:hypothetical protein
MNSGMNEMLRSKLHPGAIFPPLGFIVLIRTSFQKIRFAALLLLGLYSQLEHFLLEDLQ